MYNKLTANWSKWNISFSLRRPSARNVWREGYPVQHLHIMKCAISHAVNT